MQPLKREFEKVPMGRLVSGVIVDIEHDPQRKTMYQGKESIKNCIRLVFDIEGCKFPHKSSWMNFNYGEKATLYKKYLTSLVENAKPELNFEIEELKGMKVSMLWKENQANTEYQVVEAIMPVNGKIVPGKKVFLNDAIDLDEEEVPF